MFAVNNAADSSKVLKHVLGTRGKSILRGTYGGEVCLLVSAQIVVLGVVQSARAEISNI